jgi:hypothetical protein
MLPRFFVLVFIHVASRDEKWEHEDASRMMFDYLRKENAIEMDEEDATFVKALIDGDSRRGNPNEKKFLYEIVANKRNGLDVDKWVFHLFSLTGMLYSTQIRLHCPRLLRHWREDRHSFIQVSPFYFPREIFLTSFGLGTDLFNLHVSLITNFVITSRMPIRSTRSFVPGSGFTRCYIITRLVRIILASTGDSLILFIVKAIEYMLVDSLVAAEPYLKLAEQILQPDKFVYLTDDILATIERSTVQVRHNSQSIGRLIDDFVQELATSRAIIDRIHKRELYKCVDYKIVGWQYRDIIQEYITPERIVSAAKAWAASADSGDSKAELLTPGDVIVHLAMMHHGMKDKNPMDSVLFYSKYNINRTFTRLLHASLVQL